MTVRSCLAPKGNSVLGLSVTIGLHAVLAVLLALKLHPPLPKLSPQPVPIKLLSDASPKNPDPKPLPMPVVIHAPVLQPVLAVPLFKLAETPKPDLPKIERPNTLMSPPPPAASPRSEARQIDFQSRLMAHLNSFKRYPADARRQGKMGVVMVRFSIDRQGHMLAYRIERGSGHASLDEETARLMQRADPFPAPPDSLPGNAFEFVVPVQYTLG